MLLNKGPGILLYKTAKKFNNLAFFVVGEGSDVVQAPPGGWRTLDASDGTLLSLVSPLLLCHRIPWTGRPDVTGRGSGLSNLFSRVGITI